MDHSFCSDTSFASVISLGIVAPSIAIGKIAQIIANGGISTLDLEY